MSVILKTEKLRVEFKSRELGQMTKVALNGLDLEVSTGEVFGFLGPNGAGKTTTMNVLLGFVRPSPRPHHLGSGVAKLGAGKTRRAPIGTAQSEQSKFR